MPALQSVSIADLPRWRFSDTAAATAGTITTPEAEPEPTQASMIGSRDWGAEDSEILLKIAMAEAEGESVEGKALVMLVVLNRVWSEDFPGSLRFLLRRACVLVMLSASYL